METTDYKSFHYLENGDINFSILDTVKTEKSLIPGVYNLNYIGYPQNSIIIKTINNFKKASIYDFTNKSKLDAFFKAFFLDGSKEKINNLGFLHKVGVLLYGKEGTGKSTIINHYTNAFVLENKAIVFHITSLDNLFHKWEFITKIRRIQSNPIVVIFEEVDSKLKECEGLLKSILDGSESIDNFIAFATTNHIESIDSSIKNRASRFKFSLNIEKISKSKDVYLILKAMLKDSFSDEEIKEFSEELKNSTLDTIKQFCLDKVMSLSVYTNKQKTIGFNLA